MKEKLQELSKEDLLNVIYQNFDILPEKVINDFNNYFNNYIQKLDELFKRYTNIELVYMKEKDYDDIFYYNLYIYDSFNKLINLCSFSIYSNNDNKSIIEIEKEHNKEYTDFIKEFLKILSDIQYFLLDNPIDDFPSIYIRNIKELENYKIDRIILNGEYEYGNFLKNPYYVNNLNKDIASYELNLILVKWFNLAKIIFNNNKVYYQMVNGKKDYCCDYELKNNKIEIKDKKSKDDIKIDKIIEYLNILEFPNDIIINKEEENFELINFYVVERIEKEKNDMIKMKEDIDNKLKIFQELFNNNLKPQ